MEKFASILLSLGLLGSLVIDPKYMSYVFIRSFNSTDADIAAIVHRAYGDHPKVFVV